MCPARPVAFFKQFKNQWKTTSCVCVTVSDKRLASCHKSSRGEGVERFYCRITSI